MYFINTKRVKRSATSGMSYWNVYKAIADQQNTLIAGTTGSGKSTVLQGVLYTICAMNTAEDVELWLADPKRVDLIEWYDRKLPHLSRYANTTEDIKKMIADLVFIMEQRFTYMENKRIKNFDGKTIYLVVDELGDLVMNDKKIVDSLKRILQLGRAAGIRSIFCTQSPSRLTLPAVLQVNFTARLALRCVSTIESRQIINAAGAESLPKYGQGIFLDPNYGMTTVSLPMQNQYDIDEMTRRTIAATKYRIF